MSGHGGFGGSGGSGGNGGDSGNGGFGRSGGKSGGTSDPLGDSPFGREDLSKRLPARVGPGADGHDFLVGPGEHPTGMELPFPTPFPHFVPPPDVLYAAINELRPQRVVHVLVFARYAGEDGKRVLQDIGFLDANSGDMFHLILVGYFDRYPGPAVPGQIAAPVPIPIEGGKTWYYDGGEFNRQLRLIEKHTTWTYDGGTQLLVLDVDATGGRPATIGQMINERKAQFDWAITVDMKELIDLGLVASLDHLLQALRHKMPEPTEDLATSLTFRLSDRLGLKLGKGVAAEALAKVLDLKWVDAAKAAMKLTKLAVRDLRRVDDN